MVQSGQTTFSQASQSTHRRHLPSNPSGGRAETYENDLSGQENSNCSGISDDEMQARLLVELHYVYANTHTPTDVTLIVGILANSRSVHVDVDFHCQQKEDRRVGANRARRQPALCVIFSQHSWHNRPPVAPFLEIIERVHRVEYRYNTMHPSARSASMPIMCLLLASC